MTIVLDELSVKVGKAEETLEFLYRLWDGPRDYILYLIVVHTDSPRTDVITHELGYGRLPLYLCSGIFKDKWGDCLYIETPYLHFETPSLVLNLVAV